MIVTANIFGQLDLDVLATSVVIFLAVAAAVMLAAGPVAELVRRQERQFDLVLRRSLLLDIAPRTATVLSICGMLLLAAILWMMTGSVMGALIGLAVGVVLPSLAMRYLRHRRMTKLADQLVGGIQTLAAGVRAGLNLVGAMELVARDGPVPLRQEFAHLLSEYEYGRSLEQAMDSAVERIDLGDFRLLFAALQTHRERGGNLGETLDRIAAAIREIQRLEGRTKALTAQGRATARWLGAMPIVVMAVLYFFVDAAGVRSLFQDGIGKMIVLGIIALNVVGFLWVRKIVSVDV